MNKHEIEYWNSYLNTLAVKPKKPIVSAEIAGNLEISDELLKLFLLGKKTAASGLVKEYELEKDPLPKIDDYWIILNSKNRPKCIVKTLRVEFNLFDQVPIEVAIAEGEGDLSLKYWRDAHTSFYAPLFNDLNITNLSNEMVVTEFFELVYI